MKFLLYRTSAMRYGENVIDVKTLRSLMNLVKKHGCIIIYPKDTTTKEQRLEIYDDYKE